MRHTITHNLANAITATRIVFMPLSLAVLDRPWLFAALWLVSGLSDAIDGTVARALGTQSERGAHLDWWADLVMYGVIGWFFVVEIVPHAPWVGAAIGVVFAVRMLNLAIGYRRFGVIGGIHTLGNKIAGVAVFCAPALYLLSATTTPLWIAAAIALLSALEETFLLCTMPRYDPDARSLLTRSRKA